MVLRGGRVRFWAPNFVREKGKPVEEWGVLNVVAQFTGPFTLKSCQWGFNWLLQGGFCPDQAERRGHVWSQ